MLKEIAGAIETVCNAFDNKTMKDNQDFKTRRHRSLLNIKQGVLTKENIDNACFGGVVVSAFYSHTIEYNGQLYGVFLHDKKKFLVRGIHSNVKITRILIANEPFKIRSGVYQGVAQIAQ